MPPQDRNGSYQSGWNRPDAPPSTNDSMGLPSKDPRRDIATRATSAVSAGLLVLVAVCGCGHVGVQVHPPGGIFHTIPPAHTKTTR